MLAGCSSSSLLSPTRRLRSEAVSVAASATSTFPMNTQRLDLQCGSSFSRKETPQNRPLARSISLDNNNNNNNKDNKKNIKLKQNIKLPPLATTRGNVDAFSWNNNDNNKKSLKRLAEENNEDESCLKRQRVWFTPTLPFSLTCNDDDDNDKKICFAPTEVISAPWVTKLAGFSDKDNIPLPVKEHSSASSESTRSVPLRVTEPTNGSPRNPYSQQRVSVSEQLQRSDVQRDLELVNLLTSLLEAIRTRNIPAINHYISRSGELASPTGRTPITRLIAYYTEALSLRVTRTFPHIFHIQPPREFERQLDDEESSNALRFLNQITPIPKFIHFTANEMLLRAFEGKERVHVIDFDIKQGLQWPSFFQSLATRPNPPKHVRITGVGESKLELNETGDRLHGFAESMGLPFEFHPVVDRLEDVRLWMLHVKENESVAVNCVLQMHKTLHDGIRDFVGLIRSANPVAVILAEQESEHDSESVEMRVVNSVKYYSAVFDAVGMSLGSESVIRGKIEEVLFGREIRNIVACEGSYRVERHLGFGKWRRVLEGFGLRNLGVTEREVLQSRMLVRMYGGNGGLFNVERSGGDGGGDGGGVTLRWSEQKLYTVSAWSV